MSAIEHHEQGLAGCAVDTVVVCKLGEWEPVTPVSLSVINEDLEVLLDLLVNSFCLAIHLWVEDREGIPCNVEHPVKLLHELGDKLWSLVRDHSCQHSMSCVDVVSENSGPSLAESSVLQATGMMAFENWSTIMSRASHLFDLGRPVTISTEMWVHGSVGIAFGWSGTAFACVLDLVCWQTSHPLM